MERRRENLPAPPHPLAPSPPPLPPPARQEPRPPEPPPIAEPPVMEPSVEPPPVELLPLTCPACGGLFQVATTLAGSRVACPNCRALVMAAAASPPQIEPPLAPPPIAPTPAKPTLAPAEQTLLPPSPKERTRRRHARNLILWLVCLAILLGALWLLQ